MSGCLKLTRAFVLGLDSKAGTKILKATSDGAGSRMYPSRNATNDMKTHFRVDQGHCNEDATLYMIHLQAKKESDSPGVQTFIRKHSTHAKLASARIDRTDGDPTLDDIKALLLADLQRRERDEDFK